MLKRSKNVYINKLLYKKNDTNFLYTKLLNSYKKNYNIHYTKRLGFFLNKYSVNSEKNFVNQTELSRLKRNYYIVNPLPNSKKKEID